jgi:hypothetical protein
LSGGGTWCQWGEEAPPHRGRIAFARISVADQSQLPFDLAAALVASLRPGTRIERYNRRWRMGRIETIDGALVTGRIGYEATAGLAELWNEQLEDFEETTVLQGRTSPFVIDLNSRRVAFSAQRHPNQASDVYRKLSSSP